MNILQIRSAFEDNGPGSQSLTIAQELSTRGHQVLFAGSGGVMAKKIREAGFEFKEMNILSRNARDPISVIKAVRAIRDLLISKQVEVVHGHNAAVTLIAFWASLSVGREIKIVHSVRGIELRKAFFWRNWIYKFYPAQMLAVCEFTKNELIKIGANPNKIHVSYNGVNVDRFDPDSRFEPSVREEFGIPDAAIVIGHVGSMSQDAKGQAVLIRAFKLLYRRHPNLHLVLVGDGRYRPEFESEAKREGVIERTHFAGQRFDIPAFQSAFDIFSLPSIRGEMFPNAILEAMAMGNPWVGSDISGLSELTGNNLAGHVLPIGDVHALAAQLETLISNRELREKMGLAARELVMNKFTIASVCDRIEKVYSI